MQSLKGSAEVRRPYDLEGRPAKDLLLTWNAYEVLESRWNRELCDPFGESQAADGASDFVPREFAHRERRRELSDSVTQ